MTPAPQPLPIPIPIHNAPSGEIKHLLADPEGHLQDTLSQISLPVTAGDYPRLRRYRWSYRRTRKGTPIPYRPFRLPDGRPVRLYLAHEITGISPRDKERRPRLLNPGEPQNFTRGNLAVVFRDYPRPRPHDSLYRGVTWSSDLGMWRSELVAGERYHFFGYHPTQKQAARAYYLGTLVQIRERPELAHFIPK